MVAPKEKMKSKMIKSKRMNRQHTLGVMWADVFQLSVVLRRKSGGENPFLRVVAKHYV